MLALVLPPTVEFLEEDYLTRSSSIIYPGTTLGYAIRKFGYTNRKNFQETHFCMGKRIDMRNTI